jgi:hypothetical protein
MDKIIYSGMSKVALSKMHGLKERSTFYQLITSNDNNIDEEELRKSFLNEFKIILENQDLNKMIQQIFQIEEALVYFHEKHEDLLENELNFSVSLKRFYQKLSPLLLQALLEHSATFSTESDQNVIQQWKEAIRIAVEEEIYSVEY